MKKIKLTGKPKFRNSTDVLKSFKSLTVKSILGAFFYRIFFPLICNFTRSWPVFASSIHLPHHEIGKLGIFISSAVIALGYVVFALPLAPKKYFCSALWGGLFGIITCGSEILRLSNLMFESPLSLGVTQRLVTSSISCSLMAILQTYIARLI